MPSRGRALSLRGLSKFYGPVCAVQDVSLSVEAGEFLTLLGPSGSGKTTILMMLAGFVEPSSGGIWIDGEEITGRPPHRREVGVVFQNYALFPHMTVAQNLAYPLEARRWERSKIGSRVKEMLALVRLEGYENRYPRQLSGGQQQRVAFARALIFDPPVVLMDEPFSSLDKQLREEMQLEMKQLHSQLGLTVVSVTHDQTEALTMSDRVAVLRQGRLEQVGSPRDLYARPRSAFVANFLGDSNFLRVRAQRAIKGRVQVATADGVTFWAMGEGDVVAEELLCLIRPEEIRRLKGIETADNVFEGRVEEVIYLGGFSKYWIRIGAETTLIMKHENRLDEEGYKPGAPVRVGWNADGARLFAEKER